MLLLVIIFCVFSHFHITDAVPFNPTTASLVPVRTTSLKGSISRKIRDAVLSNYAVLSNNVKSSTRKSDDCTCTSFRPDKNRLLNGENSPFSIRVEKGQIAKLQCIDPHMDLVWKNGITAKVINLTCYNDCWKYKSEDIPICQGIPQEPVIRCEKFSDESTKLLHVKYEDDSLPAGSKATFSCRRTNQTLVGERISECRGNAKWTSPPPLCSDLCPPIDVSEIFDVRYTNGTNIDSKAYFYCKDTNHLIQGIRVRTCLSTGQWSDANPTCKDPVIRCTRFSDEDLNLLVVQYDDKDIRVGSMAHFSCKDNDHRLSGKNESVCRTNGTWSSPPPQCKEISCDRPEHPEDGQVAYSSLKFRSRLKFKCNDGYLLTPNEPVFCTSNGTWSTTDVKCIAKTCDRPDHPENGQVIFTSLTFRSELKFKCSEGYLLKPNEPVFCTSEGTWSRTDVQCVAKTCDRPKHPENGQAIFTSLTFRSTLKFKCDDGYLLKPNVTVFCASDGTWSRTDVQCVAKTCDRPEHPENGQAIFTSVTFRSELKFQCDDGFLLKPNEPVFCTSNGTWSRKDIQCIAKTCDRPEHPENGQVIFTSLNFRSTLRFNCNEGYLLKPNEPVVCTSDGTWSRTDVRCVVKTCNRPEHPENGQATFTSLNFGSQLSFKCDEGYHLQANGPVYCTSDGNWNSTNVQCVEVLCDPPTNPKNGRVIHSSLRYGSELRYECNEGFKISQNKQRKCTEDGTWSNSDLVCKEVQCVQPVSPENGRVRYSSLKYGSELRYECDMGFIISQHTRRKCTQDGTWSNSAPVCKEITCEMPLSPEYGTVQISGKPTVDSTASYSCEDGRKIVGSSVSKCLISGVWEFPPPKCVKNTCEVPLSPAYGTVQLSRYPPKENSTATYKCVEGWIMNGAATSKCLNNGWSHTPPKCIRGTCDMPLSPEYGTVQLSNYPPKVNTVATYSCENNRTMIGASVSKCLIGGRWQFSTPRCRRY